MKHPSGRTLLLTFPMLAVCVVTVVYIYMSHTVSTSVAASIAARDAVSAALASKSREQSFMQLYQSTATSWAQLPTFFVPSNNAVSFIEALEGLGNQSGTTVGLSAINADNLDSANPGTLGKISAHVDGNGSWSNVMRTLKLAEVLPFKVDVQNVRLDEESVTDKSGSKHSWRISFDINAGQIALPDTTSKAATSTATSTPRSIIPR